MTRKEYHRDYYKAHRAKMLAQNKESQELHRAERKDHYKEYRKLHQSEIKKSRKRYWESNRDAILSHNAKYKKEHPQYMTEYHRIHRDNERNTRMQREHGITLDQFNQMLMAQDNSCAICDIKFVNSIRACIDHDHVTGKIRQLLCSPCNLGIGNLKDDYVVVKKAAEYLKKWK